MKMPYEKAIESITGLISEFITDPDKKADLLFQIEKLKFGIRSELLKSKTTPKVDAFVKILLTINEVILPWARPIGSFAMTAVGLYFHWKGIELDGAVHAMLDVAFPGWMTSRHVNKQTEIKAKAKSQAQGDRKDYDWE